MGLGTHGAVNTRAHLLLRGGANLFVYHSTCEVCAEGVHRSLRHYPRIRYDPRV